MIQVHIAYSYTHLKVSICANELPLVVAPVHYPLLSLPFPFFPLPTLRFRPSHHSHTTLSISFASLTQGQRPHMQLLPQYLAEYSSSLGLIRLLSYSRTSLHHIPWSSYLRFPPPSAVLLEMCTSLPYFRLTNLVTSPLNLSPLYLLFSYVLGTLPRSPLHGLPKTVQDRPL